MSKGVFIAIGAFLVIAAIASTQVTLFVVQPIGAIPEGRTLLLSRTDALEFIDSADAMCERRMGGVSLFCRAAAMGAVVDADGSNILARLPYSQTLYGISTGGKSYDR